MYDYEYNFNLNNDKKDDNGLRQSNGGSYPSDGYAESNRETAYSPSSTSPYQPNFTMPGWNGAPSPKKARTKKRRLLKFCSAAAAMMIFSFGFGYLGSFAAIQTSGSDQPGTSMVNPANTTNVSSQSGENSGLIEQVAATAANSVVEITTEGIQTGNYFQQQIVSGAGSGVIISADGYIVTNNHVVDGADKITVTLRDGTQYPATLIGADAKTDLAVVKIDGDGLSPAVMGSSSDLKVGETAVAIGNPLGQLGGTVTNGIISALDRQITIDGQVMTLLQTNAAINPGNSGGGLFNQNGELIGIVNAKSSGSDVEGLGFAIPIDIAQPVISDLINYGYVQGRISLGISLIDIDDVTTAMMYRVSNLGVFVLDVSGGSAAENAGIQPGDRIVSIDGQDVSATADVNSILDQHSIGDTITITVERGNRQGSARIVLEEYKGDSLTL